MHRVLEQIKADTAETIAAQARERGLSVDDYLRTLLPADNGQDEKKPFYATATPDELALAYAAWAASHSPNTPVVLDDRRQSIYED
jgi:hypothetical protein